LPIAHEGDQGQSSTTYSKTPVFRRPAFLRAGPKNPAVMAPRQTTRIVAFAPPTPATEQYPDSTGRIRAEGKNASFRPAFITQDVQDIATKLGGSIFRAEARHRRLPNRAELPRAYKKSPKRLSAMPPDQGPRSQCGSFMKTPGSGADLGSSRQFSSAAPVQMFKTPPVVVL